MGPGAGLAGRRAGAPDRVYPRSWRLPGGTPDIRGADGQAPSHVHPHGRLRRLDRRGRPPRLSRLCPRRGPRRDRSRGRRHMRAPPPVHTGPPRESVIASALAASARLVAGSTVRSLSDAEMDTTQRIYIANHSSHLDFIVLWAHLPPRTRALTRPVAAADYWSTGIRRYLAEQVFHAVLIAPECGAWRRDRPA